MNAPLPTPQPASDAAVLTGPAQAAAAELDRTAPSQPAIVAWLSAHVAALEHAVLPAALRAGVDTAPAADIARRMEHVLLQVHQALNGDGRGSATELALLTVRLRELLAAHMSGLQSLADQMRAALADDQWTALLSRYDDALRNAPSRPHPHTPHGSLGERIAFPIARAFDRMLDALDSRVVPPLPDQRVGTAVSAHPRPA